MAGVSQQMNLYSLTRMALTLGPGLGFLLYLHSATLNQRPDILDRDNRIRDTVYTEIKDNYDFIIIGGGSAGSVLANRLSENPFWSVLLIEAGPDEISVTDMPMMFPALQLTPFDWKYKTEPGDKYCQAMVNEQCNWPRGKVLGGCSVLNAMLYVRGNRRDYDRWADIGNPGWSFDEVLPYFKKSEDMTIDEYREDPYHGTGGYLTVEKFRYRSPLSEWWLDAVREAGYDIRDINGEYQTGFSLSHGTLRDGLRCSTAKAFLRSVSDRPNLDVSLHSHVHKVLLNDNNQAYGVKFTKFGLEKTVYNDREVILSAGALASPHLLMLSGIGPKEHLEEVGIDPLIHSPGVGMNLQDHVAMGGASYLFDPGEYYADKTCSFSLPKVFSTETVNDFANNKSGPVYWLPVCESNLHITVHFPLGGEELKNHKMFWLGAKIMSGITAEILELGAATSSNLGIIIPALVAAMAYFQYELLDPEARPIDVPTDQLLDKYDFIVVGAGSAGAVVANRLSEIEQWKVLLLEAGGDETEISDVPLMAGYLQLSQLDWQYKSEPQGQACLGMNNGRCNWPRGKVIGGSSVLNYMLYLRGNKKDYDIWESLGNPGWGSKDALYYFKKSEDNQNPYLAKTHFHSKGGYLTVSEPPFRTPLVAAFIEGGKQLGYKNRDINGQYQTGFMMAQGTVRHGSRCSTGKGFLRPIRLRPNLHVAMKSHVTRVLIDPISKVAFGVEFIRDGKLHRVRATKEVILSAGAVNSPQLLMLSGVGPSSDLALLKIPVIQDLKVGHNLQDHIALGGLVFTINKPDSILLDRIYSVGSLMQYAVWGKGPLTIMGGVEGLAFVNTKYANASDDFPDIEFHFVSGGPHSDKGAQIKKAHGLSDEFYNSVFKPIEGQDAWGVIPMLLRPRSKGFIKLRSKKPTDYPLIYPNYFDDEFDMKTLIEGVRIGVALSQTPAFQNYQSTFVKYPPCEHLTRHSDDYYECMIRLYSATIYHPVGTAKMGPIWDKDAVVDPQLRVYGIKNLRVIDASIMPNQVSGNTNAPVIMIGEKGADLVKEFWLKAAKLSRIYKTLEGI
uniref:Glucose-methanol-choline oxidoreductase N-terminal domain-containing protein n=1 Tax=Dendroctonus ponderosae TaxID=77166 RepID=A0AAR5Q9C9_DENPD